MDSFLGSDVWDNQPGVPVELHVTAVHLSDRAVIPGMRLDFWAANATGFYSDNPAQGTAGVEFMRGFMITDANGVVKVSRVRKATPDWPAGHTQRAAGVTRKSSYTRGGPSLRRSLERSFRGGTWGGRTTYTCGSDSVRGLWFSGRIHRKGLAKIQPPAISAPLKDTRACSQAPTTSPPSSSSRQKLPLRSEPSGRIRSLPRPLGAGTTETTVSSPQLTSSTWLGVPRQVTLRITPSLTR